MSTSGQGDVTRMLREASDGSREAVDRLLPLVYDELRRLAQSRLAAERSDHTLEATALVHEAYIRLIDQTRVEWRNRAHFMAVAAQAIRRILVDHARGKARRKRGDGERKLSLDAALTVAADTPGADLVALHEALDRLAASEPAGARVVELRFFGGLTATETAEVLDMPLRTVERRWQYARAWLFRELSAVGVG